MNRLTQIARLRLTQQEREAFAEHLKEILSYFDRIQTVPLPAEAAGEPSMSITDLRPDRAEPAGIRPEGFSPHMEDGHFKVPKVIE